MELLNTEPLVKPEHYKKYINFKYDGLDASLYYTYFASPVCDKLVLLFPGNFAYFFLIC